MEKVIDLINEAHDLLSKSDMDMEYYNKVSKQLVNAKIDLANWIVNNDST